MEWRVVVYHMAWDAGIKGVDRTLFCIGRAVSTISLFRRNIPT